MGVATGALFPGQGAYFPGALTGLQYEYAEINDVFKDIDKAAVKVLGHPVAEELLVAPARSTDEWLQRSPETLQLAIYGIAVATYRMMHRHGLRPEVLIGHSLGEIAALVCAGAFTVADGAEIVCHRTLSLRQAGLSGYMAALNVDVERAERLVELVGDPMTVVAVENHSDQTVLSGRAEALDSAAKVAALLRIGFTRLASPFPFHSPLLERPAADLAGRIRHIEARSTDIRVYSPILGRVYESGDDLTAVLAGHLVRRVHFAAAVRQAHRDGIGVFVECGALDALSRITRRVLGAGATARCVAPLRPQPDEVTSMRQALAELSEAGVIRSVQANDGPTAHDLHRALLPDVEIAAFASFWRERGDRLVEYARREYAELAALVTVPAQTPVPVAAPLAVPVGVGRPEVLDALVGMYAEALEYPVEVFAEDTDLEAELGVDSVKQTELLSRVSERYGLPARSPEFRLSGHNTLGKIADLVVTSGGGGR
jgi:acyl transferase domain-containing protein/acyl carrier protein